MRPESSINCCNNDSLWEGQTPEQDPSPSGRIPWFPPLNGGKTGGVKRGVSQNGRYPKKRRRQEIRQDRRPTDAPLDQSVARHADVTGHAPGYATVELGHEGGSGARGRPHHRHDRWPRLRTVARTPTPGDRRCRAQRERLAGGDRELRPHPAAAALAAPLRLPPRPRPAPASRRSGPPAVSHSTDARGRGHQPGLRSAASSPACSAPSSVPISRSAREVLRQVRARHMDRGEHRNRRARAGGRPCGTRPAAAER